MQPIYEKSSNKNVHYTINDQFLKFWFRFVYKYTHIIEAGGNERLRTIVERDFTTFSGKSLENYFNEVLKESGMYTRLGYWHDRKGENEIDIIAEDEVDKKIEFIEVKRQVKNFDEKVLKAKSELFFKAVGTFNGYEIAYSGLMSASYSGDTRPPLLYIAKISIFLSHGITFESEAYRFVNNSI